MFTIFEARSIASGETVPDLAIQAWYYDLVGSRASIGSPVHIGDGRYSLHCENAGTVVLETETSGIYLPILHFHELSGTDVSALATSEELQTVASGRTLADLATPEDVTAARDSIISQCRTASGFATPADVKLTTTTETVEVISQTVDLSGIPASVWNYGTIADRVVTAGSVEISGDVQVDASSIAAAVWSSPERELTQDVATPADVKLTTTTQTVDLTDLKTYGDANWKTAEGFARAETVDPALNLISALIKRWKVSGSTLTAYGNSGEVLGTFTLVKDTSGNIIEVR